MRVTGNDCSVPFIIPEGHTVIHALTGLAGFVRQGIKKIQGGLIFEKRIQFKAALGVCGGL